MAKKADKLSMLKDRLAETKDRIMDLEEDFEDKVSENPIQSVAIAFGAGVVVGAVLFALSRRR